MTKVLNIDSLAKEAREITLGEKTYRMVEMSVENFIDITKRAERLEKKGEDSISSRIEFLVDTVLISFPDCPKDVLRAQSLNVLNAVVAFARDGSIPEGAKEVENKSVKGSKVGAKKKKKAAAKAQS